MTKKFLLWSKRRRRSVWRLSFKTRPRQATSRPSNSWALNTQDLSSLPTVFIPGIWRRLLKTTTLLRSIGKRLYSCLLKVSPIERSRIFFLIFEFFRCFFNIECFRIEEYLKQDPDALVGEIGLDFLRETPKKDQMRILKEQLLIAISKRLRYHFFFFT